MTTSFILIKILPGHLEDSEKTNTSQYTDTKFY